IYSPNQIAVSKSPSGGVTFTGALSDWVIKPRKLDIRFRSVVERPVGIKGNPDQSMPCCIANRLICCNTASLSPLKPPPLVKAAASLPCHVRANQRLEDCSINSFIAEVRLPI